MDVHEAAEHWNDLLLQTRLLWEGCQKLRQETESATEVRGGSFATLLMIAGYAGVLAAGLRKAMDDVSKYRHRDKRQTPIGREVTGEDWLRRMDELLGGEGSEP
jgi:hypothetical protein